MLSKSKKKFLVFLSLFFGVLVIFGAAKFANIFGTSVSFDAPTSNNGLWKSALSIIPGYDTPTRVEKGNVQIDERASMATTTTDLVARRLLVEYTLAQQRSATSTMSDADAQSIANALAQAVVLPQKKLYKLSDLNISSDNSHESNLIYIDTINILTGNKVGVEQKEDALAILTTAMNTHDSALLSKLNATTLIYQKIIKGLLTQKTPSLIAPIHLRLLQGCEDLRSATVGLQSMLKDPVIGIAALTEYRNGINKLLLVKQEYQNFFSNY